MKNFTLVILALLFTAALSAQNIEPTEAKKFRTLSGDIYLLNFFIDTQYETWRDGEIDTFLLELEKSQQWIEKEALKYNVDVRFINNQFDTRNEEIYVANVSSFENSWQMMRYAMEYMGFKDHHEYFNWYNFDIKKQKVCALFFVKSRGRSHAYDFNRNNYYNAYSIDCAILYSQSWLNQYVIAHELLHLFGAWDLYRGESQSAAKAQKLLELYPHSIMINTHANFDKLMVDELTAWRVGWNEHFKAQFLHFKPEYVKEESEDDMRIRFNLGGKAKEKKGGQ